MADKDHDKEQHRHQATGLQSPADRGARPLGQVDEKAAEENRRAGEAVSPFTPEQLATPAPTLAGSRQMYIIVGPYRGSVLTMPDAEAEDAKDSHWAVEMDTVAPPFDPDNPPMHDHELTDEDRQHAVEAADAWAAKVNAPPEPEPPPEGETAEQREARERRRQAAMHPGGQGDYQTRGTPDPTKRK